MKRDATPLPCSLKLAIGRKPPLQKRLKTRTVAFQPAKLTKENQNLAKNTRERPHFTLSGDSGRLLALKRSGFLFSPAPILSKKIKVFLQSERTKKVLVHAESVALLVRAKQGVPGFLPAQE